MAWVASFILCFFILYALWVCTRLFRFKRETEKALAQIEAFLKQRRELAASMVEQLADSPVPQEQKEKLVDALRQASAATDLHEKSSREHLLGVVMSGILTTMSGEGKAGKSWNVFKDQLVALENGIEEARRVYNQLARIFNFNVEHFPTSIFARMMGMKELVFLNIP